MIDKKFHIGAALSVISGRCFAANSLPEIQEIVEYMLGSPVLTHEIPKAMALCREDILRQHDCLNSFKAEDAEGSSYELRHQWLKTQAERFGSEYFSIVPIHSVDTLTL